MNNRYILFLLLLSITGCDNVEQRLQENRDFTQHVLARPQGRIEPLPEIKPSINNFSFDFREDLFMPIQERQQNLKNSTACYTPEERGYRHAYTEKSLDDFTFLRYRRVAETFFVTFWDGQEIEIVQKNTLIGKKRWQLIEVNAKGVTLAQLDQCSKVKSSKTIRF